MILKELRIYMALLATLVLAGCANKGIGPQGGPKDSIPPVILKETPMNGTLRFQGDEIVLQFNEYIQLDDAQNKVLVSPPMPSAPIVKAVGKKVLVTFQDTLAPETTYSVDFGTAICDNNERNPLGNYVFSFSTGDVIDSLEVHGTLLHSQTLNPMQSVLVGLHRNLSDSAIAAMPFCHVARTDTNGFFSIRNVHPGQYRIYALNDVAKDYVYQPGDGLAFSDTIITPLPIDTAGVDAGVLLRYFEEDKQRHYFVRCLREEPHQMKLFFSAPQDSMPRFEGLPHHCMSASQHLDTLTCWLLDSVDMLRDTIPFLMTYMLSDSLYDLQPQTDTVLAIYRAPKLSEKAKAALEKKNKERMLDIKFNTSNQFEIYNPIVMSFPVPVALVEQDSIRLYEQKDSVPVEVKALLVKADSSAMRYEVRYPWKPEMQYILKVDSAAFTDIYGHSNQRSEQKMKIRSLDEYSTLTIITEPYRPNLMVQLLSEKEQPVRTLRATANGATFEYVKPTSYYVRVYEDMNADSVWTTGDLLHHRQPEPVWYFPTKLTLRANWEFEETIVLRAEAMEQKPKDIRKPENAGKKK